MFKFNWYAHQDGYEWLNMVRVTPKHPIESAASESLFLLPRNSQATSKVYDPLEDEKTLFAIFADLGQFAGKELNDQIIKFANQYGWLGIAEAVISLTEEKGMVDVGFGEEEKVWSQEIDDMSLAYRLWRYLKNGHTTKLMGTIHWEKSIDSGDCIAITYEEDFHFEDSQLSLKNGKTHKIAYLYPRLEGFTFQPGDLIGPAKYHLQNLINKKLWGNVSPRVIYDQAWNLHPYVMPHNLLSAMWLQLYQATTGQKKFIQCEVCGGLIALSEKSRSTKKRHINCSKAEWKRNRDALQKEEGEQL